MIWGRNRILFTKLNVINSLERKLGNQTWLKDSNVLQNKLLPKNRFRSNQFEILIDGNESEEIVFENDAHSQKYIRKSALLSIDKKCNNQIDKVYLMATEDVDSRLMPSDVITIFVRLNLLYTFKRNKLNVKKRDIVTCGHFQKLCSIIKYSLNQIDSDELLLFICFCRTWNVPEYFMSTADIIQELHQRKEILNLQQLIMLYHILLDELENEYARNLKKECESLLLILAKRKMRSKLIEDKVEVLRNATKFPLPNDFKTDILYNILDLGKETWCEYRLTKLFLNLLYTVNSLDPDFRILENKSINILMECSGDSRFVADLPRFINLLMRFVYYNKIEYKSELFDTFINSALKNNLSFKDKMEILFPMLRLKHIHHGLIVSLLKDVQEKPELLNDHVVLCIGNALVYLNLKRKDDRLDSIFNYLDNLEISSMELNLTKQLIVLVISISLGHFPEELLKSLCERINEEGFSTKRSENWISMLYIHNSVAAWHPSFPREFLSREKFLTAVDKNTAAKDPVRSLHSLKIKEWIGSAIGIDNCVLSDVSTKHGLWIDQVMVLNKLGEPIRLRGKNNKEIINVEDIFVPPDHKLVFILNLYHYMFCKNIYGLRSKRLLKIKLLEELGGVVILTSFTQNENDFKSDSEISRSLWKQIQDKFFKRLQILQIDGLEEPITVPYYPYVKRTHDIDVIIPNEIQWKEGFLSTLEGQVWYTDGCKYDGGHGGSGVYYPEGDLELSLNLETDFALEAEINGILECAKEAYVFLQNSGKENSRSVVNIVTDSQRGIRFLVERHCIRSKVLDECVNAIQKLSEVAKVRLIWAPGHSGIEGNTIADKLARQGATVCDSDNE